MVKVIQLNNGIEIPVVGCGTNTYGKVGNQYAGDLRGDTQEMDWAIENGYRHFDSAQRYRNEKVVGAGIKKSSLPRENFFITTKLGTFDGFIGEDWAHASIEASLQKLQTDYIDLFLIHSPWDNHEEMLKVWDILEDYYQRGVFRAIGVSNFKEEHIDLILQHGTVKPAVNQIASYIGNWNEALIAYNKANDIATVAWSPLRGDDEKAKPILEDIGNKYGKTYAQVLLRYQIERDVIVIPKSHNKERQAQNLAIFDFELTASDHKRLASL